MPDAALRADLLGLSEVLKSLRDEVKDLRDQRAGENNRSSSSIRVEAGGAATWLTAWVSTCACCMMFGMAVIGAFWISSDRQKAADERAENRRDIRDMNDYLAAIYAARPELRDEVQKATTKSE